MPIWKCSRFLDQKLLPKNNPKMFCMEFFLMQSQIGLKYSHYTFFAVVFNSKVRPPKFLTFINSWDQKSRIQIYWGSQLLFMKEHFQSPLEGCSHTEGGLKVTEIFLKAGFVLCRELDRRPPETTFQPKLFYENILFHWQPDIFGFTDWEKK